VLGPLAHPSRGPVALVPRVPNLTTGMLPIGKLHTWVVATWRIVTWEVALGKLPLGKYLTPYLITLPQGIFGIE